MIPRYHKFMLHTNTILDYKHDTIDVMEQLPQYH